MDFSLGNIARAVRNSAFGWPMRMTEQRARLAKEHSYVSRVAQMSETTSLELYANKFHERVSEPDEVFILGSGSSVLDVPPPIWERIAKQLSIGFGPWALHSFVPDFFAYGPTRGLQDYDRVIEEVMGREDILRKKPTVLFLRSDLPEDIKTIRSLPSSYRSRTFVYGRVSPISRSRREIFREMRHWHIHLGDKTKTVAFDSGSTLVRLISLLLMNRAKKVVLVGVDLNTTEYFWEKSPSFLAVNGFENFETGQSGSIHDILLPTSRPSGVLSVIEDLRQIAVDNLGSEIEVMSARSALASVLPLYSGEGFCGSHDVKST